MPTTEHIVEAPAEGLSRENKIYIPTWASKAVRNQQGNMGKVLSSACGASTDLGALLCEEETLRKEEMHDIGVGRTV